VNRIGLLAFLAVTLGACGVSRDDAPPTAGRPAALAIAAASDLRYALDELVNVFREAQPDIGVSVSYGSSGNFYAQLANGAPFDLFLSADLHYPRQLTERGLTEADTEFVYGEGRIVVWVPAESGIDVETRGLQAVLDGRVRHVAIANPEHAPYGRAAEQALRREGLLDRVKDKLVLGENISQTLQFVQSGSAEIGIVALSLASAPSMQAAGRYWVVPADAHGTLEQGGIVLRAAARPDAARAFRAFMMGTEGRRVLKRYGFVVPEN
jgi:molybdate transport system substrate-binding protein